MDNQEQSNIYHFVLIHIGNELPLYINSCIHQIRLFNSSDSSVIWMMAQENELEKIADSSNLKKIPLESIQPSPEHIYFDKYYTNHSLNNFWKYTIERFFYLEEFMRIYALQNVFHIENDNLLYINLKDFLPAFVENYKGMAVTLDCDYRVIPGFAFIRDFYPLVLLSRFINGMIQYNKNDMQMLADFIYTVQNDGVIQTLPILLPEYDKPLRNLVGYTSFQRERYINHFDKFHGIFDAAAIGQYLGGISPRNNPQGHNTIGFINETSIFQCSSLDFKWEMSENGISTPFTRYSGAKTWHPVFTLHIHSKNLPQFLSDQFFPHDLKTILSVPAGNQDA
jgi:hypothetical protein